MKWEENRMQRVISIVLCVVMLICTSFPVFSEEIEDANDIYGLLLVEFSDNLGKQETLQVMLKDNHVYVNAEQLGDRLGYQVQCGNDYVAIYNKSFSSVPYGLTTFYYDSKKVCHMLFSRMIDYEAPIETISNVDGVWIPFEFALLLLNSSYALLDNQIHIEMPEKNIIDIYMDILKNNDRYMFDWSRDAGASDEAITTMGISSYCVQLFNGLLDKDGTSWSQLMNSFCLNTDSYDAKYAETFAKLFCTQSNDELEQSVKDMKEKMAPFNGDNWIIKAMDIAGNLYDDKIGELSKITEDLKKKIQDENSESILAYNKSYQTLDKVCSRTEFFNDMTDPFVTISKKFEETTSFLQIFYSAAEIIGYASEFQNQDKFAMDSLMAFVSSVDSKSTMSEAMKKSMKDYKNTLETDIVSYSAYNYLVNHVQDLVYEAVDLANLVLNIKEKTLLMAWNLAKDTIPFYKEGFTNTDSFLQSMYSGIVQADALSLYQTIRNSVFSDKKNITSENLYMVTQYCYAYLKSCYITREAAIGSLTDKIKESNPTYVSTQKVINQEIVSYLIKLENSNKVNENGCYGFLPEDNEQYLIEFNDDGIRECVDSLNTSKNTVLFEKKYEGNYEYAIIKGINNHGEMVWEYDTEKYEIGELDRVAELGICKNLYYLVEEGIVIALNLATGEIVWKNNDFKGSGVSYKFDNVGTLYICGYHSPDFCAIDENGKTLFRISHFDDNYYWPGDIELNNNYAEVTMYGSPDEKPVVFEVSLSDYTYRLKDKNIDATIDNGKKDQNIVYTKEELHNYFTEKTNGQNELYFIYDDYDNDGIYEAFGITGESVSEDGYCMNVKIYYISSWGEVDCINKGESLYGYLAEENGKMLLEAKSAKFLVWEKTANGPASTSYIWGVLDGKFFETDISGMYGWFGKLSQETNIYVGGITFIQDGCRQEQDYYFTYDENSHQFVLNE